MKHARQMTTVTCPDTGKVYPIPAGGSTDDRPAAPKGDGPAPPWGSDEEFNPERAWTLIQNLRSENADLKPKAAKAQEIEDAGKSELEKAQADLDEERAARSQEQAELARLKAAVKHGLSDDDLDLLDGVPADQVEDRAEKLARRLAATKKNGNYVRREGASEPPSEDPMRNFARQLFDTADN